MGSCNAKISPSGKFGGGFSAGWHDYTEIRSLTSPYDLVVDNSKLRPPQGTYYHRCNIPMAAQWAGFDLGSAGGGVEQLCWAANSDKWICENVMYNYNAKRGTNQFIINWIDKQAIVTTRTPDNPPGPTGDPVRGTVSQEAFCGDFWVQPPAGVDYAYEDTSGNWHQLPKPPGYDQVATLAASIAQSRSHGALRAEEHGVLAVTLPYSDGLYTVTVSDMAGRTIASRSGQGIVRVNLGTLQTGACIARVAGKNFAVCERTMLAQ